MKTKNYIVSVIQRNEVTKNLENNHLMSPRSFATLWMTRAGVRKAVSLLCTLCIVLFLASCTEDDLVTQTTPLAPQGMKTVTVDFQLPESKPTFGEGETRATTTDGTWANGDELLMMLAVHNYDAATDGGNSAGVWLTLNYDGSAWDVNVEKSYSAIKLGSDISVKPYNEQPLLTATQDLSLTSLTLMLDENFGEVDEYSMDAYYAPDVEWVVDNEDGGSFRLKANATTTAPELWYTEAADGNDNASLNLQWSENNQARLRVYTGAAGDVVTLTSSAFIPNKVDKPADGIYTATTQADGYAYFYGRLNTQDGAPLTSGFNLSLTAVTVGEGDAAFTCPIAPVTLLEASTLVPVILLRGSSYRLDATKKRTVATDAIAVIDGTSSDLDAVKTAIAGKSTIIVTGETLATYSDENINNEAETVVGEAIRQLTEGTIDLVMPEATVIGDKAFRGCTALTSVSLSVAITIGDGSFASCDALASVSLPEATTIGASAFNGCNALTSVSLPAATSIGNYAFYCCKALSSVSLPVATTIGNYAFYVCSKLASVSAPKATTIGDQAFINCAALTSLTFGEVIMSVGTKVFDGVFADNTAWTTQCTLTLNSGQKNSTDLAPSGNTWAGKTWKSISYVDDEGNAVEG